MIRPECSIFQPEQEKLFAKTTNNGEGVHLPPPSQYKCDSLFRCLYRNAEPVFQLSPCVCVLEHPQCSPGVGGGCIFRYPSGLGSWCWRISAIVLTTGPSSNNAGDNVEIFVCHPATCSPLMKEWNISYIKVEKTSSKSRATAGGQGPTEGL
ncbi:hypothetical protein V2G26_011823 [Clonostachys chloroleuca]